MHLAEKTSRTGFTCRPRDERLGRLASTLLVAGMLWPTMPAHAQGQAPAEAALPSATTLVTPSTRELEAAVAGLRIAKWKAPGPVKDEAQGNAASITRDLQTTLPGLLTQSDAAPHSVANAFAVYRNLEALYEVLLRVAGTADLAAPDEESASLTHALGMLERTRRSLADSILLVSQAQETALAERRTTSVAAPSTTPAPQSTVVSDGPAAPAARRKPKAKAPVTAPARATPPS